MIRFDLKPNQDEDIYNKVPSKIIESRIKDRGARYSSMNRKQTGSKMKVLLATEVACLCEREKPSYHLTVCHSKGLRMNGKCWLVQEILHWKLYSLTLYLWPNVSLGE